MYGTCCLVLKIACTSRFVQVWPMFLRPYGAFVVVPASYPRLTAWALLLRCSAAFLFTNSRLSHSCPERPIQRPILDGFGDVFWLKAGNAFEVGDGTGYLQDAVVGARGQALLQHGTLQQALAVGRELAEDADMAGSHLGVAVDLVAGSGGKPLQLGFPGPDHAFAHRG